ncbi:MAG: SPFH/Band 7/PHB domain protein [Gammaproteobacteria bacterium]|nr:SPFH/Band 7/PHB domain protein [Gammaproteobacteria bacterium]
MGGELNWPVIIAISIVPLAAIALKMAVKFVPQGKLYTVERFGRYSKTLEPGVGIIVPVIHKIGRRLSVMEEVMDVPSQEIITKDNAMVTVDGVVFFKITDARKAAYEVNNLSNAIMNLTMTNIRTVMGSMDLDELLSKRDQINQQLLSVVDEATDPWGVKILRVEIKDITPPRDLVEAMAGQMKAERDKRASILEAEGERQAEILKAEGEKRSKVLEAEGRKEAAFLDAEARERLAEAEAKATQRLSQAIDQGNIQAINYFVAEKYVKALEKIAGSDNQKLILMPLEAASVIGALGGIGEITKEAFGKAPGDAAQVLKNSQGNAQAAPEWMNKT